MKRILTLLSLLFCNTVCADTINLHWLNEDGTTYENSTCVIDSDLILPSTPPTKYGYTFTGWKMSNYIPIEYLESTGTQWIDTGLQAGTTSFALEIDYYISVYPNSYAAIIGNESNTTNVPWVGFENRTEPSITMGGNWSRLFQSISRDTGRHNFIFTNDYSKANLVFDGTDKGTVNSYPYVDMGLNLYLLANNQRGKAIQLLSARLYSVKIWNNDILVRDFIPVLDTNGTPCMFDKVESKFYYNQGTGQFIAGPVL